MSRRDQDRDQILDTKTRWFKTKIKAECLKTRLSIITLRKSVNFYHPSSGQKIFHYLEIKYRLSDLSENVRPDVYNVLNS